MNGSPMSAAKKALLALEQMRERLDAAERAAREPIAIVGIGLRVPGASDVESFWSLLRDGVDATSEVPRARWDADSFYDSDPDAAGKINTRRGGFLADIDLFDAEFFGVSPRESRVMDPQHRLLLEVAWEAFEHAAIAPAEVAGSRSGVFVGLTVQDYLQMLVNNGDERLLDAYAHHGNVLNAAAGRLSYTLGLHGPSMAIDTACSSSLVAIHLACQSLRSRECDLALAGGVNLMLSPLSFVRLSRGRMLAPDGRCKTFDAAADGYARAEGCGVLLLKRLSVAQAHGDRIVAVIRGSAVNQDGHTSALTVPNGLAQRAVIRDALTMAGVKPAEVAYVEAHGTGTALGDPIEVDALADVFGAGRREPLLIGSVKTNVGHLESASGVTGLIKVALSLQRGIIPQHLHFRHPSPHIAWDDLPVAVPATAAAWPSGKSRIAGVSSFGASGTNAHVIVEQAPERASSPAAIERPHHLLVLSAESDSGLRELGSRYARHLAACHDEAIGDICYTASVGRSHFTHRAAVTGQTVKELRAGVAALAAGEPSRSLQQGTTTRGAAPKIAFLFTGQGAQYAGMGRELFDSQPAFRTALEACDHALQPHLKVSLLSILFAGTAPERLDQTTYTQPAIFALEYALAKMLASWGIEPGAVLGHSVGEIAAACVSGVLSLNDAAALIAARGRLMGVLPEGGAMVAIAATEAEVTTALAGAGDTIALAAVNAPDQVVLSGERSALESLLDRLQVPATSRHWLNVSHAFHSPLLTPMLDGLADAARGIAHAPPSVPFVSNVTGTLMTAPPNAAYWRQHAATPVRFADGLKTLAELGCTVFLEVGPAPKLLPLVQRTLEAAPPACVATLRRGRSDWEQMAGALASLYVAGARIDWRAVDAGWTRSRVSLPTHPSARKRHWFEAAPGGQPAKVRGLVRDVDRADAYEIVWRAEERHPAPAPAPAQYIVVGAAASLAPAVVEHFSAQGRSCVGIELGGSFARRGARAFTVDASSRADIDRALKMAVEEPGRRVVVFVAAPAKENGAYASIDRWRTRWKEACGGLVSLAQALGDDARDVQLVVVTAGAVDPGNGGIACDQTPVCGVAQTIRRELPELGCSIVDLDPTLTAAEQTASLAAYLEAPADDSQVALRGAMRYVPRLVRHAPPSRLPKLRADGTYLVTGGRGGAGLAVAQWLVARGARSIALVGRSAPSAETARTIAELQRSVDGLRIEVIRADVADREHLDAALDGLVSAGRPLRGVIHAAGIVDDAVLADQRWSRFESVFAPKAYGAWYLHELTAGQPLDFFILFSSLSATVGSAGQANYAAANAFLDGLAGYRRRQGLCATSIAWGPWQVGMLGALAEGLRDRWTRQGLHPMPAARAAAALDCAVAGAPARIAVADADWARFVESGAGIDARFFSEVAEAGDRRPPAEAEPMLLATVLAAPATRRHQILVDAIESLARPVLGSGEGKRIDPRRPLREIGLDSLMAVELRNALGARLGHTLPATLLFNYPTINSVADHVLRTCVGAADMVPDAAAPMAADAPVDDLAGLSSAEAEDLLLAELDATERT